MGFSHQQLAMAYYVTPVVNEHGLLCSYSYNYMWQSQVEYEHYSTVSGLVISLECFIEITPDFLCPSMND